MSVSQSEQSAGRTSTGEAVPGEARLAVALEGALRVVAVGVRVAHLALRGALVLV